MLGCSWVLLCRIQASAEHTFTWHVDMEVAHSSAVGGLTSQQEGRQKKTGQNTPFSHKNRVLCGQRFAQLQVRVGSTLQTMPKKHRAQPLGVAWVADAWQGVISTCSLL